MAINNTNTVSPSLDSRERTKVLKKAKKET